jgi:ribonuclease HI
VRWLQRKLRGNPVWVRVGDDGRPAADAEGRVDVIYKLQAASKVYRASLRNLEPDGAGGAPVELVLGGGDDGGATNGGGGAAAAGRRASPGRRAAPAPSGPVDPDAIIVYTDGACTGNPGPMGIGVVIVDRGKRREIGEYLGHHGTNNIAELTAILRALESVPPDQREREVRVHADSAYAIGLLSQGWKAKANQELVAELRELAKHFPRLRLIKVKGHAGVPENERADQLATGAISERRR